MDTHMKERPSRAGSTPRTAPAPWPTSHYWPLCSPLTTPWRWPLAAGKPPTSTRKTTMPQILSLNRNQNTVHAWMAATGVSDFVPLRHLHSVHSSHSKICHFWLLGKPKGKIETTGVNVLSSHWVFMAEILVISCLLTHRVETEQYGHPRGVLLLATWRTHIRSGYNQYYYTIKAL